MDQCHGKFRPQVRKNSGDAGRSEKHQLGNQKVILNSQSNMTETLLQKCIKDNLQLQYFHFLFLNEKKFHLKGIKIQGIFYWDSSIVQHQL